jgi:hypothetical protein
MISPIGIILSLFGGGKRRILGLKEWFSFIWSWEKNNGFLN